MWEPEANRENTMSHRQIDLSATNPISLSNRANGTVLGRWPGARVESAANVVLGVPHDGRFYVAVKVTPTADGWYHYEYAVHNRDNNGRSAQFRVPLCTSGRFRDAGMRGVPLGNVLDRADIGVAPVWSISRQGDDLVFDAPPDGAQPWNTVFNFWFDSDAAPAAGSVDLTQAIPNPGANSSVRVASDVPALQANLDLGGGCGIPTPPALWPNGQATLANPGFGLDLSNVASATRVALLLTFGPNIGSIGGGCSLLTPVVALPATATPAGAASWNIAIPNDPSLEGLSLYCQALEGQVAGALASLADASNIVRARVGNATIGCR
jgi:hypothetical protein